MHTQAQQSPRKYSWAFGLGIGLNSVFAIVELGFGLLNHSAALVADAGHNASDVLSLVLAWVAAHLASRKGRERFTFGFKKSTILASLFNAILIIIASGFIPSHAIEKFKNPEPVAGETITLVALIGVLINAVSALLFAKNGQADLNVKSAYLHLMADAAVSLGVVIAGLLIQYTGYDWIDPIISLLIVCIILYSSWDLLIESLSLSLDASPKIDLKAVEALLCSGLEVEGIENFHLWALSTTENAPMVALRVRRLPEQNFIPELKARLHERFNVSIASIELGLLLKGEQAFPTP